MELSGLFANPGPTSFIQVITGIVEALGDRESRPQPKSSTPTRRHRVYLTTQQMDELVAAYQAGATTKELASEYRIHRHTVSIYLRRRGEPRRHQPMGSEEVVLAGKLYESGLSLAKISERLGPAPNTIRRVLMAEGVEMRDCQGGPSDETMSDSGKGRLLPKPRQSKR